MKYMMLLYDNADTRDAFFGPGSETLGAEVDAVLKELEESGELVATEGALFLSNALATASR